MVLMVANQDPSERAILSQLATRLELTLKFRDQGAYPAGWVYDTEQMVEDAWPAASRRVAQLLVALMEATPSSKWMPDYLHLAWENEVQNSDLLLEHFDEIASSWADAVTKKEGLE